MSKKKMDEAIDRNIEETIDVEGGRYDNAAGEVCGKVAEKYEREVLIPRLIYPNYGNKETCPEYYTRWPIEPNTFCIVNQVSSPVANIIKYIMRHDMKGGLKDLTKARDYLNMMIEHHYGKENV